MGDVLQHAKRKRPR